MAPIKMEIGEGEQHGCAKLVAGTLVKIETRCIGGRTIFVATKLYTTSLSRSFPTPCRCSHWMMSFGGVVWE
jgi:hypothetical protein